MKRKLTDNEVDSVNGGGAWVPISAEQNALVSKKICPYCGAGLKDDSNEHFIRKRCSNSSCDNVFRSYGENNWYVYDSSASGC